MNNAYTNSFLEKIQFQVCTDQRQLDSLISEWRKTLTGPQDDMWDDFITRSNQWIISSKNALIGYASANAKNHLLQFYLRPEWLNHGSEILGHFLFNQKITKAILGTNNPVALSCAMHHQKSLSIHTYLFNDLTKAVTIKNQDKIKSSTISDLDRLVNFYHKSNGGSKEWLRNYLDKLVSRSGSYFLEQDRKIIGTCEVRSNDTDPGIANIGMVVSPYYSRQGLGTYLLGVAKTIALNSNRIPICSCEITNIGSLKAIHENGFRSIHQMLSIEFK